MPASNPQWLNAVVERGASLREVHVDDGVVGGEGLFVERAHVTAGALRPFDTGAIVAIDDPLLVAARDERRDRRLASRAAALLALPLALVLDAVVAMVWSVRLAFSDVPTPTAASALLLGVLTGRRAWIGTADGLSVVEWVERGPVLAIDDALVPEDADALARRLARAWYALSKAPGLDARLVARTLARRVSRSGERVDERAVDEGGERGAKVVTA